MLIVSVQVEKYCQLNSLPTPTQKDFTSIGSYARQSFNYLWMKKSGFQGPIEGTGFARIKEGKMAMVVNFYPDEFFDDLNAVIERFYSEKKKKMEADEVKKNLAIELASKPKRPRIPSKKPLYSSR